MLRYHKKVYTDIKDIVRLKAFTDYLNGLTWQYTSHTLDNIKSRAIDIEGLLKFIKSIILKDDDIFEFYLDDLTRDIIKVCYRINYGIYDIILVLNSEKSIITIYLNSVGDNHNTLKTELYNKK